jgi:SAM-dependent methyltransferase
MWEQSKAAKRRFYDGLFHARYFVGKGIDIGGGPDPLGQYAGVFARMQDVRTWDFNDGDAQWMESVPDNEFDFVHSSHCLEHLDEPKTALAQWIRITRPGGFIIVTVPDEDLYEKGNWPSLYNSDHKWTFTVHKPRSWSPRSVNVLDVLAELSHLVEIERIALLRDFVRDHMPAEVDQTATPVAECGIEIILRKRPEPLRARSRWLG